MYPRILKQNYSCQTSHQSGLNQFTLKTEPVLAIPSHSLALVVKCLKAENCLKLSRIPKSEHLRIIAQYKPKARLRMLTVDSNTNSYLPKLNFELSKDVLLHMPGHRKYKIRGFFMTYQKDLTLPIEAQQQHAFKVDPNKKTLKRSDAITKSSNLSDTYILNC